MKILLVSWSILPRPGGSSIIVENLVKHFSSEELVVLGGKGIFDKPIHRAPAGVGFKYFFSEFHVLGRGHRFFSSIRKWRFNALIKEIEATIQKEEIDYVLGVFPDDFYCYAACLAAKAQEVPFSSYFHNTYADNVAITDPRALELQTEIFAYSDYVFVMSKGMQRFYEDKYQLTNVIPLVHTYNSAVTQNTLSGIPGAGKDHYELVAIGNFNESNIEATIRFAEAIKDHPAYRLHLYTHVPKLLLRRRGLDPSLIVHRGFISPDEVHQALQQYDIAVLTHGFTGGYGKIEYETIFPTRTIPLLLSGKPIIAHSPKGSFLNDFIAENQCAELVDQAEASAVLQGLDNITKDVNYQEKLVERAQITASQFYGPQVVAGLKSALQQVAKSV